MERPRGRSRLGLQAGEQCGCVPSLSLVSYEDLPTAAREERGTRGWTKRFPLLGPLWCVAGTTRDRVIRRRDNAVYRSNSFKFEKRGTPDQSQQKVDSVKVVLQESVEKRINLKKPNTGTKKQEKEPWLDVNYSDPQDVDQEETVECFVQEKELYRLKLGHDIYYCRPYQAFHTQLRYNFSDLLETGVDSEYEEMAANSSVNNNSGGGLGCPSCVTVIPVCPPVASPGPGSSLEEPPYENIPLHKVTISVPYLGEPGPGMHRIPPLRKSKVPLKYQGIKRVKTKTTPQSGDAKMLEKSGYSRSEVWRWLYPESGGDLYTVSAKNNAGDLYTVSAKKNPAAARLQLSTGEFLAATNRLQHLDLEGMDTFVGNTLDRAVRRHADNGANNKAKILLGNGPRTVQEMSGHDVYVAREEKAKCEACLTGGHSSCSSALSSLESGRSTNSQGVCLLRSCDSDSSAIGSMNSRINDNYIKMTGAPRDAGLFPAPHSGLSPTPHSGLAPTPHLGPAPAPHSGLAPGMMRGRIRNSLPQLAGHKPYQTLEVGRTESFLKSSGKQVPSDTNQRTNHKLHLVDTNIQLHQQEWYHGNVSRHEAEAVLRLHPPGSYLVRNSESAKRDYSLSLKSSLGYMHMRIQETSSGQYVLGQFSKPFPAIPEMINHYTINRLPIKGAEHMCLARPICEQLL